jgi:tetratricopeptide (TPR) repeat protein
LIASVLALVDGGTAPSPLALIQAEMRAGQFDKAVALADQAVAAKDAQADLAIFLKATALFQAKKFAEAEAVANQLMADFPKSVNAG